MFPHLPRSIEGLVEEQARRWALRRSDALEIPRGPVITVSRQHGAGGGEVARRVAEQLGLDFFDREIMSRIAESAHLGDLVVSTLDEKERKALTDFLAGFASSDYMSPGSYREHLTRVVAAVAAHGSAVILGRGAHLILGPGRALRSLVVAPPDARVAAVARREGLSERDARTRIDRVEAARSAFLSQHFRADGTDAASFDLVVNTGVLGVDGAVASICAAVAAMPNEAPPICWEAAVPV